MGRIAGRTVEEYARQVGRGKIRSYFAALVKPMAGPGIASLLPSLILQAALLCAAPYAQIATAQQSQGAIDEKKSETAPSPRGMRLVLKDGTYHVIREYQRNGDRVRYYSIERGEWEELPAGMVDWAATEKQNEAEQKSSADLVAKVHKSEEAKRMDNATDIDASLKVGTGVFLPSGEGMFLVEGPKIRVLDQVGSETKTDKRRAIERVLTPIPVVPGKKYVLIPGAHARLRLQSKNPEFYLREAPPDPERVSPIQRSSRAGEDGPDVELIRTKVKGNYRQIEALSFFMGEQVGAARDAISIQRWEVAPQVYRFTMSETLPPGEYVLAEVLPDGLNLFVWEFGVD